MTTLNYKEDYPLLEKHPDKLKAMTGRPIEELTIDNVLAGGITMDCLLYTSYTPRPAEFQARRLQTLLPACTAALLRL